MLTRSSERILNPSRYSGDKFYKNKYNLCMISFMIINITIIRTIINKTFIYIYTSYTIFESFMYRKRPYPASRMSSRDIRKKKTLIIHKKTFYLS